MLEHTPAVALVGPRQSGKTTLALELARNRPSIYLDLESATDRARLTEPALYLADHSHGLVILGQPVVGASWEGMAIENLLAAEVGGHQVQASFYRTGHAAEVDLVLAWPGGEDRAVEIKRSLAPAVERGMHTALADLFPAGSDRLPRLASSIEVVGLSEFCREVQVAR